MSGNAPHPLACIGCVIAILLSACSSDRAVCRDCFKDQPEVISRLQQQLGKGNSGVVFLDLGRLSADVRVYAYKTMGSHSCYKHFLISTGTHVEHMDADTTMVREHASTVEARERNTNRVLDRMRELLAQECNGSW